MADILGQLDHRYRSGRAIWIVDDQPDPEFQFVRDTFPASRSTLVLTLFFNDSVVGFITVLSQSPGRFNHTTIEILQRMQAHITSAAVKANLLQASGLDVEELSR